MTMFVSVGLLGVAGVAASAAPAAKQPVSIALAASASNVNQGSTVKFTGRIWQGQTGNRTPMYFYFQRRGATTWAPAGSVWANDHGDFARSVRATTSGTWKVVYPGTSTRAAAVRGRVINVFASRWRQVASYSMSASNWQGPRIKIPTTDYRAIASYKCAEANFFYLTWNGDSYGYEYVSSSSMAATLTLNGHQGGRSGYFGVSTWLNCSWTVKVYAGSVRVLV